MLLPACQRDKNMTLSIVIVYEILTLDVEIDLLAASFSHGVGGLARVTAAATAADALQNEALVGHDHARRRVLRQSHVLRRKQRMNGIIRKDRALGIFCSRCLLSTA